LSKIFWSDLNSFEDEPLFLEAFAAFIASLIRFFQKLLCCFLRFDARRAFFTDDLFGISVLYDSIRGKKVKVMKPQNTILSAAFILATASAANAVLGFVKGRLLAQYFGVSTNLAIFYTADRIPSLIYSVLVVGAISTVFIPIFTDFLKKDKEKAFETASSIMNASFLFFLLVGSIVFIFAPQTFWLISLGKFSETEVALGANLMRIMLGAQLILLAGSLLTSVLQSFKYFLIPAVAPILYNSGIILGIILLTTRIGIYSPTVGTIIGAVLFLLIQIPITKKAGFAFSFSLNFKDRGLRQMLNLVPPRLLSVFLTNTIGTINNSLAILISNASVVHLKFALQLETFPVTLFGLSIASASLPTLSTQTDEGHREKFKQTFLTSLHQTMFLVLPISVILLVLRIPVVRIVYGVSNFPWEATLKTAYALAFFGLSVFSQSANYLFTRAFYAFKDTKTPVIISICTAFLNVLLSVFLVTKLGLGVWAVALVFSFTSMLDSIFLLTFLSRKLGGFDPERLFVPFIKIAYAAMIMGVMLYLPLKLLDEVVFDTTRTINLLILTGIATLVGSSAYLVLTKLLRVEEIELFYKLIRKLNITKQKDLPVRTEDAIS
jgi:putative peptidoglycan lipid II flippase